MPPTSEGLAASLAGVDEEQAAREKAVMAMAPRVQPIRVALFMVFLSRIA
jgi:hypothetical protein